MRLCYGSILALALAAASAIAAPPEIVVPEKVNGQPGEFVLITAKTSGTKVAWKVIDPGLSLFPVALLKDSKTAIVTSSRPGRYRLVAVTAVGDEISDIVGTTVVIGDPGPDPGPQPNPDPGPQPGPGPSPNTFRVVLVYESMDAMPANVQKVLFGPSVVKYLNAKCTKGQDGVPGWRRWDKDAAPDDPVWKPIWAEAKPKLTVPGFVIVADGKLSVHPVPASEDEALVLLKKYGGE